MRSKVSSAIGIDLRNESSTTPPKYGRTHDARAFPAPRWRDCRIARLLASQTSIIAQTTTCRAVRWYASGRRYVGAKSEAMAHREGAWARRGSSSDSSNSRGSSTPRTTSASRRRATPTALLFPTLVMAEASSGWLLGGLELQDSRMYASDSTALNTTLVDPLEILQAYVGVRKSGAFADQDSLEVRPGASRWISAPGVSYGKLWTLRARQHHRAIATRYRT